MDGRDSIAASATKRQMTVLLAGAALFLLTLLLED
jgi:hypothetical protein